MTRRWGVAALVLAALAAGACRRPEGESDARPERPRTAARSPYLIEGDELKVDRAQNLYDVVRIQRPAWLTRNRGGAQAIVVYLDDRQLGTLNSLRQMAVGMARSLQFLSATEARLRFGPTHGSQAAIVIEAARDF